MIPGPAAQVEETPFGARRRLDWIPRGIEMRDVYQHPRADKSPTGMSVKRGGAIAVGVALGATHDHTVARANRTVTPELALPIGLEAGARPSLRSSYAQSEVVRARSSDTELIAFGVQHDDVAQLPVPGFLAYSHCPGFHQFGGLGPDEDLTFGHVPRKLASDTNI